MRAHNPQAPKTSDNRDAIVLTWEHQKRSEISLTHLPLIWLSGAIVRGLLDGLLLRGAIAIGEYIQDKATVLGPAVSDVAEWYEGAERIGVIATPKAGEKLGDYMNQIGNGSDSTSHHPAWFVDYKEPLKNRRVERSEEVLWTEPWPFHFWMAEQHANISPAKAFAGVISGIERSQKDELRRRSSM